MERPLEAEFGLSAVGRFIIAKLRLAFELAGLLFVKEDGKGRSSRLTGAVRRLILEGN
ncbi:hypothetical protein DSM21852_07530 [Methylocystis bryophila]|nr:hypothetical protein DSM21852_07530 [Methylocystis bryophila]